ncbi:MAG TPA: glycosyltransferase [Blastocatellia bacterium]|nr:glycosyltransferase [Blastocatellia bacterium]
MTTPSQQPNLVSAIVPCYNQAHFLSEAIESILGQTYRHFEIIVIDDGSTDETALVASRYESVRCIRRNNEGLAAARNIGLCYSAGDYIVFLDADDRLLPEAFEAGVNCLSDHPECALAYGHVRLVGASGAPLPSPQQSSVDREHYLELLRHNYIWTPGAVMYRRSALDAVGDFDVSVNASADFDMNIRIARSYPIRCHDKVILEYRKHDANMSGKFELMLSSSVAVLRSQWKYVKGNREFEKVIESSISSTREYYGEKMVRELQSKIHACEWKRAMTTAMALLRYYPQGFARYICGKLFRSILRAI